MCEPFCVQLYRRYMQGVSPEELSTELGIPLDRIQTRITAVQAALRTSPRIAALVRGNSAATKSHPATEKRQLAAST